ASSTCEDGSARARAAAASRRKPRTLGYLGLRQDRRPTPAADGRNRPRASRSPAPWVAISGPLQDFRASLVTGLRYSGGGIRTRDLRAMSPMVYHSRARTRPLVGRKWAR